MFHRAYSKVEIKNLDKLPVDGAVIFAPNHTNALMDALSVLIMSRRSTVFVARADIFRKPKVGKILNFFKIMPIMRMRDGINNLKKNDEIIQRAVEVLRAKMPFCIFCEGTDRPKHSMLPIVKGIFRIALKSNEKLNGELPVYIVPMGIEYGSYYHSRSSLLLQLGNPINVTEFVDNNPSMETPELMMALRTELAKRISSLIHFVPDNDDYESVLDYCYLKNREILRENNLKYSPYNEMCANRISVEYLHSLAESDNAQYQNIMQTMSSFESIRRKNNIEDNTLYVRPSYLHLFIKFLIYLIILPLFLVAALHSLPIWLTSSILAKRFMYKEFANSTRFAIDMILFPLLMIATLIVTLICLPWYVALPLTFVSMFSYPFVLDYATCVRAFRSDFRFLLCSDLQSLIKNI